MEHKWVKVSDGVSIPVPTGLTLEEEANYIANKIAFMNFQELESECMEAVKLFEEGKTVPLRAVLEEMENELKSTPGTNA